MKPRSTAGTGRYLAALALLALASGCAGNGGVTTSPSTSVPPTPSVAGSLASTGPTPAATASTTSTPGVQGTPVSTPPPPPPSAFPTPAAGEWKGLTWVEGPQVFACDQDTEFCGGGVSLFGFSGGYLAFDSVDPENPTALGPTAKVSKDGVNWRKGNVLNVGGPDAGKEVVQVSEGPKGLLAVARTGERGLCGTYPIWIQGLWTSANGLSWNPLNPATAFGGGAVYDVAAGPSGYFAAGVAADGVTSAAWLSADGRSWRRAALPDELLKVAAVDSPASFAGGFELAAEEFKGCGALPLQTNSLWWSQDGTEWAPSDFPAATASLAVATTVYRVAPGRILAVASRTANAGKTFSTAYWTSVDGKSWKSVTGPALPGDMRDVFSYAGRSLLISWYDSDPENPKPPIVVAVTSDGRLVALKQQGEAPQILPESGGGVGWVATPNVAFGPAGLLVTDGLSVWFGVPTA